MLAILGLGLGLGAVAVVSGADAEIDTITLAVGLWWSVGAIVALFLGGWVAGKVAGPPFTPHGILLGALVWAIVTLGSFYLSTTALSTVLGGPIAVATESVYGVITEAEAQTLVVKPEDDIPPAVLEDIEEDRVAAAKRLAVRAEDAMEAGVWAALTLMLGAGAAIAGALIAIEPPAWAQPRRPVIM